MHFINSVSKKIVFLILCILTILCFTVILYLSILINVKKKDEIKSSQKQYHIIITGTSENESFLKQVYKGAQQVSNNYNAIVELLVPESQAEDTSLQSLLDYTAFVNCDGVIAYINNEESDISPPENTEGKRIPFITVGHYDPLLAQVSFIGTNYSELGNTLAEQIVSCLGTSGTELIINSNTKNDPNYSSLMNTLSNSLSTKSSIYTETLTNKSKTGITIEDLLRKKLSEHTTNAINLIVCLNEEDTIRSVQTVTNLNKVGKIKILGIGESPEIYQYYNKGIITSMLSLNLVKIGETAMKELFEYKKHGSANSFITADFKIMPAH